MKIKNISIGDVLEVKRSDDSVAIKGNQYPVLRIDACDNTVLLDVGGRHDEWWVLSKDLRKPRLENEREQPKLKQLDQSVFDGLDGKRQWATVSSVGMPFVYDYKPTGRKGFFSDIIVKKMMADGKILQINDYSYDASNWQDSLIERDKVELTGSDLCRAMLERGDKFVMCGVSEDGQEDTMLDGYYAAVESVSNHGRFYGYPHEWLYATPINNQGEPLTQSDVGL